MHCPRLKDLPAPPRGKKGWPWTEETPPLPDTTPDGRPWPRISIVTPSYNQAEFIEETIRSVLLQGYPDIEYIIIDGGSTDGSVEIIKKYEPWLTYWVSEPDSGQTNALNKGFKKATGEILNWLNSDDIFLPGAFTTIAKKYIEFPKAGAFVGGTYRVSAKGKLLMTVLPRDLSLDGIANKVSNWFMQPACFFTMKAWKAVGPLKEDLHFAMDFDLWLKIAKQFAFERVEEVIASVKIHEHAKSTKQRSMMFFEIWSILLQQGFEDIAKKDFVAILADYFYLKRRIRYLDNIFSNPLLMPFKIVAKNLLRFVVKQRRL